MPDRPSISVVVPAFNAERTIGTVVATLLHDDPAPLEVLVVNDKSTDSTASAAAAAGARVLTVDEPGYAGGARNRGWDNASGDYVVFIDADVIPSRGWAAGLTRALEEFPGALVGCARSFTAKTRWGWVAHLQVETPYLPRGVPREVPFLSSFCLAVPRDAPLRWDESYGGEDALFSAAALAAAYRLVFDPRFVAVHDHARESFRELRRQQRRLAYGLARCGAVQREGLHKRIAARVPLHYFALLRLPIIYARLKDDPELRNRFLHLLPWIVVSEWSLGLSSVRYAVRPPKVRGGADSSAFRS